MSHEPDVADSKPHEPRHAVALGSEGFGSHGAGRDIFFTAVQSTRMPMVVADPRLPDVPIVFVNQAFLDMTGYARDEVIGRNCRFLQGPETDRDSVALVREAVHSTREITIELLNYRKDGSTFWNALFTTPIRNAQGELVYFFSSQLDISRRRDAESALLHAQKMEALGQLTGGIAHDFNNLLQVILGNVDVVRVLTRQSEDVRLARSVEAIREAARKSGSLTQQLLAFARRQQLRGRVVNLGDLASQLAQVGARTLGDGFDLVCEFAPHLWNVRVDPSQLETAIANLLANSRDAMPGGGHVQLSAVNEEIDAKGAADDGALSPGRFVVVSVTDHGVGIAPDIIGKVMDPFFSTKEKKEGTGLGLSMVYGFAKQSGGAATVSSEPGRGTTVRMYFPVTEDASAVVEMTFASSAPKASGRILIVDDRPEIAETTAALL